MKCISKTLNILSQIQRCCNAKQYQKFFTFCHKYYSGRETFHSLAPKSKFSSICAEVIVFVTNLHTKPILPQEGRLALISFPMCCLLSFTNFTAAALYPVANRDMLLYSEINRVHIYHIDVD